jgi:hypothetical protein
MLFKRYLRPTDIYVHADIPGAATCIVRAKDPSLLRAVGVTGAPLVATKAPAPTDKPISPLAIQEAGMMAVSRSNAWKSKISGVAAWWVWAHQVSKSAPTGEFLTTGSFMIHGKKNFLPPMALEMGFGLMFRLDDASVARHLKDWKDRSYLNDERSMSQFTENLDRYSVNFDELGPNALTLGDEGSGEEEGGPNTAEPEIAGAERSSPAPARSSANVEKLPARSGLSAAAEDRPVGIAALQDDGARSSKGQGKRAARLEKKVRGGRQGEAADRVNALPAHSNEGGEPAEDAEDPESAAEAEEGPQEHAQLSEGAASQSEPDNDRRKGRLPAKGASKADKKNQGGTSGSKQSGAGKKGNKNAAGKGRGGGDSEGEEAESVADSATQGGRKKHINKKKARRYAEQDDEDRELAMLVLGHASAKTGERLGETLDKAAKEKKTTDLKARQRKAGVGLQVEESWEARLSLLPEAVRAVLEGIVSAGYLKPGEIDAYEMRSLAAFPSEQGVEILYLFSEGNNLKKAGNKSGFLAGIMRRYSSGAADAKTGAASNQADRLASGDAAEQAPREEATHGQVGDPNNEDEADQSADAVSRRARKKQEAEEIRAIIEEEGIAEEEEGKQADDVEKLTGMPLPEDVLLYAVPVCGPYAALQNFKYKVKLTPGLGKKGKVCKQAIELFTHARYCTDAERTLISGLTDPEMVAIMIGDCRLSMPGLHQLQTEKRVTKKTQRGQKK